MLLWLKSIDWVFRLLHVLLTSLVEHSDKLKFLIIMHEQ